MLKLCDGLRMCCNLIQICSRNSSLATKQPQAFVYLEFVLNYCINEIRNSEFYGISETVPL